MQLLLPAVCLLLPSLALAQSVHVQGGGNVAITYQSGTDNTAMTVMSGLHNLSVITQSGDGFSRTNTLNGDNQGLFSVQTSTLGHMSSVTSRTAGSAHVSATVRIETK